ncbi:response regulator [Acidovorax sp. NCPPB 3859]|nr:MULTISPECIES: ATP-binding protein [unclassified Acidovorax]MDA8449692.1 response regulator [Acidovorax sp. GBBC 3297]MDA8459137.1 response regulator [Acidovorax sp. GBBC 3333]MDA8464079.1 response regulator [Acidovorax sp. GBBC 3332]MDA8469206.1 response regulator [Acidovorax sp. GBBC 3299]WCM81018.1 response regulator [Acidovorax sp. GBBC 712]
MTTPPHPPAERHADIFIGQSEMARRMREHDWEATPLGPPERWPLGLKAALRILLTSRFEMWVGWGPDIAFFYNDAYRPTLGTKHPHALGRPTAEVWAEIWDDVKDRMHAVYQRGESTWDSSLMLLIDRAGTGTLEETYHTFSYSPLLDDDGRVNGLFCAVSEETRRVISERRLAILHELGAAMSMGGTRQQVVDGACLTLANAQKDLPFSLIYLYDAHGTARLACNAGVPSGHRLAPREIAPGTPWPWRLDRLAAGEAAFAVPLEPAADTPTGAWQVPPHAAFVVALPPQGDARSAGFLVCGANPLRPGDDAETRSFVQLLAGQVAPAIAQAEALESRTAERDRLRELFSKAPGFMCVLRGPDHVFEFVNDSYQQLIGRRDLEGKSIREALPELQGQGIHELLDEVYRSGRPYIGKNLKVMLQREPGGPLTEHYQNFIYQPTLDGMGAVNGIFAEGYDVTDQRMAEQELRTLNSHLESRVAERTRDLEDALARLTAESREREAIQEALRQSQKMEAVGQLTGGLAHDFNNLLATISGSLELLNRRVAQGRFDDLARYVTVGQGAARRAASLTHRMLAFSRRQTLDPKPTDVNRLVRGMEELIRRTIGPETELEVVNAVGLWTTHVDPHQLESALLNLCINSRDAMPGGGRLTIETANAWMDERAGRERDLPPGQYVSLCVTDTGTGMAPEVMRRIFEPFFTTKPIGMGTGLGLSMVYGFARQSGGQVRAYSEPGMGTTMCIYLPRHEAQPEDSDIPTLQLPEAGEGSGVVLVVDDEPSVRALVVEVLHEMGYQTIEAHDGASALQVLQSRTHLDLLITDVGLPGGMNGRQLADGGRLTRPDLQILFITGYAENAAVGNGHLERGMHVLTKPFTLDALAHRVRTLIRQPS